MSTEINQPDSTSVSQQEQSAKVSSPASPARADGLGDERKVPPQFPLTPALSPGRRRSFVGQMLDWRLVSILLLAAISVPFYKLVRGSARAEHLTPTTAVPVAVAKVSREDLSEELVCDAELRPYQ